MSTNTQAGKTAGQPRAGGKFAARPKPLSQGKATPASPESFAAMCILPSCIADVSELAGNPKAMGLATRLALAEKGMEEVLKFSAANITGLSNNPTPQQAIEGWKGVLRTRDAQLERINSLNAAETRLTSQVERFKTDATTLQDKLNIAQVQLRNANEEKATVADLLERTSIASDFNAQAAEWSDGILKAAAKAAGIDDPERLAHKVGALQASDRNNGELRQEIHGLKLRIENLAEDKQALIAANETLGNEVDRLIADSPRLPLWARALAAVVGAVIIAAVFHRMGFEARAQLIGGAR